MITNYTMLRWWAMACSMLVSAAVIQYKGLFKALWFADPTGLSFVALGIFVILTGFAGVLTYRISNNFPDSEIYKNSIRYLPACWYASELLMAIGMMGTLIGFMMMLGPALAGFDLAGIASAKTGIFGMATGMSTAVSVTLIGLLTSHLMKLQLINLEVSLPDEEE